MGKVKWKTKGYLCQAAYKLMGQVYGSTQQLKEKTVKTPGSWCITLSLSIRVGTWWFHLRTNTKYIYIFVSFSIGVEFFEGLACLLAVAQL